MTPLSKLSPARSNCSAGRVYDDEILPVTSYCKTQKQQRTTEKMKSPRYIVTCLAIMVFIVQFGANLSDVPSTRLLEDIICHEYWHNTSTALIPEDQCLVRAVQGELNVISMGALIFGYLPGILVAIPYGSLADRRGRKAVLGLCVLGMILSQLWWIVAAWNWQHWDLRYVWSASIPSLLGGGEAVAEAMVFAIVADVSAEEKRATYFQVEICSVLLAEALAPFAASAMMSYSVWLPILISPGIMAIGGLLLILIPETLDVNKKELDRIRRKVTPTTPNFSLRVHKYAAQGLDPPSRWSRLRHSLVSTLRLLQTRDVPFLIPSASLTIPVATATMGIILRYIPMRFGWTLTQTGMALGVRTGLNILVLLIFLPLLGNVILSKQDDKDRDLVLARISAVLLVVGQAVFSAAPTVAVALVGLFVLTLGTGAPSLCRAVLVRLVSGETVGRVFGVLAVCEMLGYLCCSVGFGALYQVGLDIGLSAEGKGLPADSWELGLVFYVAAVLYFVCGGLLWIVDPKDCGGDGAVVSLHSDACSNGSKGLYEMWVSADVRTTRRCPSSGNVSLAV